MIQEWEGGLMPCITPVSEIICLVCMCKTWSWLWLHFCRNNATFTCIEWYLAAFREIIIQKIITVKWETDVKQIVKDSLSISGSKCYNPPLANCHASCKWCYQARWFKCPLHSMIQYVKHRRVQTAFSISTMFTTVSRMALGPTQPPIQWVPVVL